MSKQRKKKQAKIRSGEPFSNLNNREMHPLMEENFKQLPEKVKGVYEVDIEFIEEPGNIPSLVISNEVIYYEENITSIKQFKETLPNLRRGERRIIKQCCWDNSLYIVQSEIIYDGFDAADPKKSFNYLGYADNENGNENGSSTTDSGTTPVPPDGGGEQVKKEGTGAKVGRKNFPSNLTCRQIKKMNEAVDKNKIQVGIVDFGWGDYHADTIKSIIESEFPAVQMHDYNLVASFKVASVLSICCQIARAINERMDILNMSIGYYSMIENPILKTYIEKASRAGVLIVCSSGNSNNDNSVFHHWPSNFSFEHDNVISVSAHQSLLRGIRKTDYSNYDGTNKLSLNVSAIGKHLYPDHINLMNDQGRITHARGTSFSAAYVVARIARAFDLNGKVNYLSSIGFDRNKILDDIM